MTMKIQKGFPLREGKGCQRNLGDRSARGSSGRGSSGRSSSRRSSWHGLGSLSNDHRRSDNSVGFGSRGRRNGSTLVGGALAGDVARLGTLVADFTSGAERATVGCGTVTGDVTELTAGVALHSLSLAVTSKVVGATALVASGSSGVSSLETTTETTLGATASPTSGRAGGGSSTGTRSGRASAVALGVVSLGSVIRRVDLLQGDLVGCSCSSGRRSHRLGARWGSRLGYVQVPGSCNTAWLVGVSCVGGW